MRTVGLFAGMGGFELAFSRAGFETTMLVESDPHAQAVLRRNFPDVALRGDVRSLSRLPARTELVLAGFPCQDLSMVGPRTGFDGEKSSVVRRLFQLVEDSRVETVVVENVYFMLHLNRGRAMSWLVSEFERLGFRWAYRVLDTMGFGLPQRRRRVYLVASKAIDPRRVLFAADRERLRQVAPTLTHPLGFYWTEGRSGIGLTIDGIPPLKIGSSVGIPSAPAVLFPDGEVLMPHAGACAALQGFPKSWTGVSNLAPRLDPRWKLAGNAVSVPVASWVAQQLKRLKPMRELAISPINGDRHWPDAAWNVGDGRFAVAAGDKPIERPSKSICQFRDDDWQRLSNRALDGFISRVIAGGLRTPEGFVDALRAAPRRATTRSSASASASRAAT